MLLASLIILLVAQLIVSICDLNPLSTAFAHQNIFTMKLWYCICLLFCIYCISILVDERLEVTYAVEKATNTRIDYLICMKLTAIFGNQTVIQLSRLKNDLWDYFNRTFYQPDQYRFNRNRELFKQQVLEPIEAKKYLLFNEHFCLHLEMSTSFVSLQYNFERPTQFALDSETLVFHHFESDIFNDQEVEQLVVLNEPYPYSNCKRQYSRFRCLNDCYKQRYRLSRYFYAANETTGLVYLNGSKEDARVVEHETACLRRCKHTDCKLVHFIPKKNRLVTLETTFKAYPAMSQLNFCLQLASLVCLIFGLSFNQLTLNLIEFIILNFTRDNYFAKKQHLFLLKMLVLLVVLAFCVYLYVQMVADHRYREQNPLKRETITGLLQMETVHLVICVKIEKETSEYARSRYRSNDQYLMSKTLSELENETNGALNESLDEIFLEFQGKPIPVDWFLQPMVLFSGVGHSRCFQIHLSPKEVKYQRLLAVTKLVVRFKTRSCCYLFLLADQENFHSKSFFVFRFDNFVKKIVKRSRHPREDGKESCVDYRKTSLNCTSRWNCIDRCLIRRFLDAYSDRVPFFSRSVIDKRHFTENEWNSSYLSDQVGTYQLIRQCELEFEDACEEAIYVSDSKQNPPEDYETFSMELYYDVVKSIEEEASLYELILDILSVQSVFFGLTLSGSLQMGYSFARARLKVRKNRIVTLFIYLLCSIGFVWHLSQIFDVIVHGELTESQHFELVEHLEMPVIALCFAYNRSAIDENHRLTGHYLEQLTGEIGAKQLFRSIGYLDASRRWVDLNASSNFRNEHFRVETFFLLENKCFSLNLEMTYTRTGELGEDSRLQVLQIAFNHSSFFSIGMQMPFMTRKRRSLQFSKIGNVHYWQRVLQEIYSVRLNDRFRLLKSPLSLFAEQVDDDVFLNRLMADFNGAHHLLTLNMPVKERLFDQEIRDDLFEQFYRQQHNESDQSTDLSPNYQREFATNHMSAKHWSLDNRYDFAFSISFFRKCVVISSDGLVKLLLNLLNVLSLYLNSNLLDFHLYLSAIRPLCTSLFKMLLSYKRSLSSSL